MFGFGILWLVLIGIVVYLLVRNYHVHGGMVHYHGPTPTPGALENPLDIAKRRFAAGEVTKEQFDEIVQGLKEADKTPPGATG